MEEQKGEETMTDQQQFCPRCGAVLISGANFCETCGAPVGKAAAAQPTEPQEPATPADPQPDPLPPIFEPPPAAALPPRPAQTPPPPPARPAQTPPPATYPQLRNYTPPPAAKSNSKLPWILGAVGCLGILCLALIGGGLIFFLNSDSAADAIATAMPVSPTQPLVVAPTQPLVIAPTPQPALPTQAPLATQAVFSTQAAQPTVAAGPITWPVAIGQQMTTSYFSDDFSSKTFDWADVSDNLRSWLYEDAHYAMHLFEPDHTIWAYLPLDFTPTTIGFDAAVVEGYDQGAYGVICYYQDESNYYFVSVDPVYVEYSIGYVQDDEYYSLLDEMWMDAAHLNPSPYAVNSIMVACDRDMITLFVNNELEAQADLGGLVDAGDTAIYGETWKDTPSTGYKVLFDNLYAFIPQQ